MNSWPPGLPVYGLMTPYPATPLYDRLRDAGRLTRPKHWLDFKPFQMAYTPDKITIEQAEAEVRQAWSHAYSPEAIAEGLRRISTRPFKERMLMFFARLAFRGIYFPQMKRRHWFGLMWKNRQTLFSLIREAWAAMRDDKNNGVKGVVDGKKLAPFRQ